MTSKERMLKTLRRENPDRAPDLEFGAWVQTIERWHKEGLPEQCTGVWNVLSEYFGTEDHDAVNLGVVTSLSPAFEDEVLEERGDHIIKRDKDGATSELIRPELGASIPRYIKFAVETRADWEKLRDERLNPDTPERIAPDMMERYERAGREGLPVVATLGSLYGWIRNWMGVENLSYAVHDDPEWVEEMMEHLTQLFISIYGKLAGKVKIDICTWWEDMCFKTGPLLSPAHFERWMVPRYKRITKFLKDEFGCEFNLLDSDGHIHQLAGLWMQGGINYLYPLEVAANSDGYRINREVPGMVFRGHYDKRAIIAGKDAINREFDRIEPLYREGGFIPHVDHLVPPDTPFENYVYYREQKLKFLGKK